MVSSDELDPNFWAPGTVRLEDIQRAKGKDIILQPQPTDDPNDPLNCKFPSPPTTNSPLTTTPGSKPLKLYNFALTCLYVVIVFALIGVTKPPPLVAASKAAGVVGVAAGAAVAEDAR